MIRYTLTCENDHQFESWFQSASAFDGLQKAGMVTCAVCDSHSVSKTVMAPAIRKPDPKVSTEDSTALEKFKQEVEANAEYVGNSFTSEARAMHIGDKPERAIYGEANLKDAKSLVDDGIPILPLPFVPRKRAN